MVACCTLNGSIARSTGGAPNQEKYGGWTSAEDKEEFWKEVRQADIVMGGRNALNEMPRVRKPVALLTRHRGVELTSKAVDDVAWTVEPFQSDVRLFLDYRKGKRIVLCGGATTYDFMLRWNFVDKLVLVVEPLIMKAGIRLTSAPIFNGGQEDNKFILQRHKVLNSRGTLRLDYTRVNEWTR